MIKGVSDLMEFLNQNKYASANQAHVRYMFRGHGNKEWRLAPGVYRPDFNEVCNDDEDARLRIEQHLFQDFAILSAALRSGQETPCNLYALQQHHGMPTRLLDWSNNALAALYFAVADPSHDQVDGAFIALDAYELARCQGAPRKADVPEKDDVGGVATFQRLYLQNAVSVIAKWKKKESFGKWAIALHPYHDHTRMALQRSCFTFHVPARHELDPATLTCLKVIEVKGDCKPTLRRELAALGIDEFSIFGDMDHLARRLRSAYLVRKY